MDTIDKRIGAKRAKRADGKQKKDAIRAKVKEVNDERGEYVCFGCAAPRIMEARRRRAGGEDEREAMETDGGGDDRSRVEETDEGGQEPDSSGAKKKSRAAATAGAG